MLAPQIVCAACKRGSEGHDRFGKCTLLRRDHTPYNLRLSHQRDEEQSK